MDISTQSLGHRYGGVWAVSPWMTSQKCHQCGEKGIRVATETSTEERKGGEYFYCIGCDEHFHADINAARNIAKKRSGPSAASGRTRTEYPTLSKLQ